MFNIQLIKSSLIFTIISLCVGTVVYFLLGSWGKILFWVISTVPCQLFNGWFGLVLLKEDSGGFLVSTEATKAGVVVSIIFYTIIIFLAALAVSYIYAKLKHR